MTTTINEALKELNRIKKLSAFNISNAKQVKVNQFLTKYTFKDSSVLFIYPISLLACVNCNRGKSAFFGILGNPKPKHKD